ncbi:MAG: hypothetical protein ACKOQ3_06620 [Novosphingobium sp.]
MTEERRKLSGGQIAFVTAISAATLGLHLWQELRKSPEQRAKEAAKLRAHHAARRAFEDRRHNAWELDEARWKAFMDDPQAKQDFDAEYYIKVQAEPLNATVTHSLGGDMWATRDDYVVRNGDDTLKLTLHHDGHYLYVALDTADGSYRYEGHYGARSLLIGKCDGTPTQEQRKIAALIAAIRTQNMLTERATFVVLADYGPLRDKLYAKFAIARGWPPEKDAEVARVNLEHYGSSPSF